MITNEIESGFNSSDAKDRSGYVYRWTSRYNGSTKYRLISPEVRTESMIDYCLKRTNGMIPYFKFWTMCKDIAKKYHASENSLQRFNNKLSLRYATIGKSSCYTGTVPKPIFVVNVENVIDNKICSEAKINNKQQRSIKKKMPLHDVLYLWRDSNGNVKIGITSSNAKYDRISSCAKKRNTNVEWKMTFYCKIAKLIEKRLLDMFNVAPYSDGEGYTEFRTMTNDDIGFAISFARANGAELICKN